MWSCGGGRREECGACSIVDADVAVVLRRLIDAPFVVAVLVSGCTVDVAMFLLESLEDDQ